jgi:hypothetical protein
MPEVLEQSWAERDHHPQQPTPEPTMLRIGRLAIADGSIAGWLELYRDSERAATDTVWA